MLYNIGTAFLSYSICPFTSSETFNFSVQRVLFLTTCQVFPRNHRCFALPCCFSCSTEKHCFWASLWVNGHVKKSLCEAWKTKESTSAAPRGRWKRSWLWESGNLTSSQAVSCPPYMNRLHLATNDSSEQLSSLKSWCSAAEAPWEAKPELCDHNSTPTCAPEEIHRRGWLTPIVCACAALLHTKLWLTWGKSSREAKSLMSLLFLVPESSHKNFQQSVWMI